MNSLNFDDSSSIGTYKRKWTYSNKEIKLLVTVVVLGVATIVGLSCITNFYLINNYLSGYPTNAKFSNLSNTVQVALKKLNRSLNSSMLSQNSSLALVMKDVKDSTEIKISDKIADISNKTEAKLIYLQVSFSQKLNQSLALTETKISSNASKQETNKKITEVQTNLTNLFQVSLAKMNASVSTKLSEQTNAIHMVMQNSTTMINETLQNLLNFVKEISNLSDPLQSGNNSNNNNNRTTFTMGNHSEQFLKNLDDIIRNRIIEDVDKLIQNSSITTRLNQLGEEVKGIKEDNTTLQESIALQEQMKQMNQTYIKNFARQNIMMVSLIQNVSSQGKQQDIFDKMIQSSKDDQNNKIGWIMEFVAAISGADVGSDSEPLTNVQNASALYQKNVEAIIDRKTSQFQPQNETTSSIEAKLRELGEEIQKLKDEQTEHQQKRILFLNQMGYEKVDPFGYFYVSTTPKPFQDAQMVCINKAGMLVEFSESTKFEAILKFAKSKNLNFSWIGLKTLGEQDNRSPDRRRWFWITSTLSVIDTLNKWTPGEPNNHSNAESCGQIKNNLLNDASCQSSYSFICEAREF